MSVFLLSGEETAAKTASPSNNETTESSGLPSSLMLNMFWPRATEQIRKIETLDIRAQALPLARIKKIMKLDEDVKMISAEAPVLFAKAAELFIEELTLRAWLHTEDNKRRTLQRNDIAMAVTKYDMFDFLIDIVPREEVVKTPRTQPETKAAINADQVHYYFQLAQQHHAAIQGQTQAPQQHAATNQQTTHQPQTIQIVQNVIPDIKVGGAGQAASASPTTLTLSPQLQGVSAPGQVVQVQPQPLQLLQQIVSPSGELQHIPVQLNPNQMQMLRMQLQNGGSQPLIIQQAPQIVQVQQQAATPVYTLQPADTD